MNHIKEYRLGREVLRIYVDENPESQRDWDNLGKIIGWHPRHSIGDDNPFSTPDDFYAWLKTHPSIVLDLYMYDHSGLVFNTSGFSDLWDSMQVGYIFVELNRVRSEYRKKRISKKTVEIVRRVLQGEVEVYGQYVNGEVYGFTLEKMSTCTKFGEPLSELVDSCWGFYGTVDPVKNGMVEHLPQKWQKFLRAEKAIVACICEESGCLTEQS